MRRGADLVAHLAEVLDGDGFVGLVERHDAIRALAAVGTGARCSDAVLPTPVHGDLGWTVGDAYETLDAGALDRPPLSIGEPEGLLTKIYK